MSFWDDQYPESSEYSHFYSTYIQEVPKGNIIDYLNSQMHEFYTFINSIPGDKLFDVYEEGKWTIKEIVGHVIDSERVFNYRALRMSRGDTTDYPDSSKMTLFENQILKVEQSPILPMNI